MTKTMDEPIYRRMSHLPLRVFSSLGGMVTSAILIGVMLSAWPVLARDNGRDSSVVQWRSTRPDRECESTSTDFHQDYDSPSSREERVQSTASYRDSDDRWLASNNKPRVQEAAFQDADNAETKTLPPPSTQPDRSEELVDIEPYHDGQAGEYYSPKDRLTQWEPYQLGNSYPCNDNLWWYPRMHNRLWVRGEYLLWWTKGSRLPPLVTTSTAGTDINDAGVLGLESTSILFGNDTVNTGANSGGRILFGYWFDDCRSTGIEASYLGIGQETARFSTTSTETPIIARPFYDTQSSIQDSLITAYPDYTEGTIDCKLTSEFQALEVLLRHNLFRGNYNRMDVLFGWRFARLGERLQINHFYEWPEAIGPIAAETNKSLYDLFDTKNHFNGVELGVMYRAYAGRWSLETTMKLGLGCTHSRVLIDGMTTTTVPNVGSSTFAGDLLAQETNMGQYSHDRFAVVPELGVTLSYALTNRLHATFGYTFLYWSQVARPADQLQTNASQIPPETPTGSLQPAFNFIMSDYWAQGMNFGLEYCF